MIAIFAETKAHGARRNRGNHLAGREGDEIQVGPIRRLMPKGEDQKEGRIDQPQRGQAGLGPPESFGSSLVFSAEFSSIDFTPPLKFLMAFPSPDPISGRRFAPKMRKIIARMMTSSWVPNPNNSLTSSKVNDSVYYDRVNLSRVNPLRNERQFPDNPNG